MISGEIIFFLLAVIVGMIIGMVIEKQRNAKASWNKFDEYAYALEDLTPDVPAVMSTLVHAWNLFVPSGGINFEDFSKNFFMIMERQGIVFRRAVKK